MALPKIINDIESGVKDTEDLIKGELSFNFGFSGFEKANLKVLKNGGAISDFGTTF